MSDAQADLVGGKVRYPENSLLGVFDSPQQVSSAVEALTSGGFLESEIKILCGQPAAEKLRASTGRSGLTNVAMRLVQSLGMPDEETQIKSRYADSLEAGRYVLGVQAPTEERKDAATRILKDNGGSSINFFGRFVIEAMDKRTGPQL